MFIDLHAHTKRISHCCLLDINSVLEDAKNKGYDALVITNHYVSDYFNEDTYDDFIEKYVDELNYCRRCGKEYNIKIFFGIEISMEINKCLHILLYGVNEEFIRNNKYLHLLSLKELYKLAKDNDLFMVQAHPFRNGVEIQDVNYLDALEINCHPIYRDCHDEEILKVVKENNLRITVGCDYHGDTKRVDGGMYIDDNIESDRDLVNYLKNTKQYNLKICNPKTDLTYKVEYKIF